MGGTHWVCFHVRDNKSYDSDSFGAVPDIFLLKQLLKPVTVLDSRIQDINSSLCGTYCLYLFHLTEKNGLF